MDIQRATKIQVNLKDLEYITTVSGKLKRRIKTKKYVCIFDTDKYMGEDWFMG